MILIWSLILIPLIWTIKTLFVHNPHKRTYSPFFNNSILSLASKIPQILLFSLLKKEGQASRACPPFRLTWKGVIADIANIDRYSNVCTLNDRETKSDAYLPMLYAEIYFVEMMVDVITHPHFPVSPLGLIHLRNTMVLNKKIPVGAEMVVESYYSDMRVTEKGIEYDFNCDVKLDDDEIYWACTTTLLSRKKGIEGKRKVYDALPDYHEKVGFSVPKDKGIQYATVSGDWNPHHLYPLTAKLIGYKLPIAHGLWTIAAVLSEINQSEEDFMDTYPLELEFEFKRPVFMPSDALCSFERRQNTIHFLVSDPDCTVPNLTGSITSTNWAI